MRRSPEKTKLGREIRYEIASDEETREKFSKWYGDFPGQHIVSPSEATIATPFRPFEIGEPEAGARTADSRLALCLARHRKTCTQRAPIIIDDFPKWTSAIDKSSPRRRPWIRDLNLQ